MAVLTAKRQVGTMLPMIVETPDHIIIEGQSYDKATLNPTMLKPMMYHNHDGINNMVMNRSWIRKKTRDWHSGLRDSMADPSFMKWDGGAGIAKQVWLSEQNPNEFYIFASWTDHNIAKVDRSTLKVVNMANQNGHSYGNWYNTQTSYGELYYTFCNSFIWGETTGTIFTGLSNCMNWCNWDGNRRMGSYPAYSRWDKSSWGKSSNLFVSTNNLNYSDCSGQILHKSAGYLFIGIGGNQCAANDNYAPDRTENRYNVSGVYCTDLTTNTTTSLFTTSADTYGNTATGFSVPFSDSVIPTKKYTYYAVPTSTANFIKIYRGMFDENSPLTVKSQTQCTINFSGTPFSLGTTHKGFTTGWDNRTTYTRMCTFTSGADRFLLLTLTRTSEGYFTQQEALATYKTYVFKLSADGLTLIPTQIIDNDDYPLEIFPMDSNYQRVMMIYPNYIAFWAWDSVQQKYTTVNNFAVQAYGVGIDDLDRLWVYDAVGQLHLMTPFIPASVELEYGQTSYDYQGVPINSNVSVNAYDTSHIRIARPVTLTIEGINCQFEDGTRTKNISTSADTNTIVPIIITGSGYFRIAATLGV